MAAMTTAASTAAISTTVASTQKWHLGFDCATKTFAFSLSRVDLAAYRSTRDGLRKQIAAAREVLRRAAALVDTDPENAHKLVETVRPIIERADADTRSFIYIVDGETADLIPDKKDQEIPAVERLRAVARYVNSRVRDSVRKNVPSGEPLRVVIEFQMGPNAPSRMVAAALVTLFVENDVIIVGPSLKNKIATCEEGRYCYFAEKYSSAYGANKAHAKFNFSRIEAAFGSEIPITRPPSLRGHIADSFMQILGHLVHGSEENAAAMF